MTNAPPPPPPSESGTSSCRRCIAVCSLFNSLQFQDGFFLLTYCTYFTLRYGTYPLADLTYLPRNTLSFVLTFLLGTLSPTQTRPVSSTNPRMQSSSPPLLVRNLARAHAAGAFWPLQYILSLRGFCARINHPSILRAQLHCPPWCNTIARRLGSMGPPLRPPVCIPYTIQYW